MMEDEVFEYLDALRKSGVTNMMGAGAYVQREFEMSRENARDIVLEWMRTFEARALQSEEPGE